MFHACFKSIVKCFYNVLHHFGIFYWTNLLTRCPVPVSVYYVCALQKRSKIQSAQKNPKTLQKFFFARRLREPEAQVQGRPTASRYHPGTVGPRVAAGCHLDGSSTPSRRLSAYIFAPDLKTLEHRRFSPATHPSAAATINPNSGDTSSSSGTLPGLGIAPGAIFIAVDASRDAAGVVLHWGWGLCSYMVISLSHGVIFMWSWALLVWLNCYIVLCYSVSWSSIISGVSDNTKPWWQNGARVWLLNRLSRVIITMDYSLWNGGVCLLRLLGVLL